MPAVSLPPRESSPKPADSARPPAPTTAELAEMLLARTGYLAHRELRCRECDGRLRLEGVLPSYYLKQMALALVGDLDGVRAVEDRVVVQAATRDCASSTRL